MRPVACAAKADACNCAALEAVHRLHQIGALNDNLHPSAMPLYITNKQRQQLAHNFSLLNDAKVPANVMLAAHIMNRGGWLGHAAMGGN